jgi:hypothetical protein
MTRSFFLPTNPLKQSSMRSARRKPNLLNPEANTHGQVPRTRMAPRLRLKMMKRMMMMFPLRPRTKKKKIPRVTKRARLLRLRRSKKLIPAGRKNNASFWPHRGFVI